EERAGREARYPGDAGAGGVEEGEAASDGGDLEAGGGGSEGGGHERCGGGGGQRGGGGLCGLWGRAEGRGGGGRGGRGGGREGRGGGGQGAYRLEVARAARGGVQSEEVLHLEGGDHRADASGEPGGDGVGNELDELAEAQEAHRHQDQAGHQGGDHQPADSEA